MTFRAPPDFGFLFDLREGAQTSGRDLLGEDGGGYFSAEQLLIAVGKLGEFFGVSVAEKFFKITRGARQAKAGAEEGADLP